RKEFELGNISTVFSDLFCQSLVGTFRCGAGRNANHGVGFFNDEVVQHLRDLFGRLCFSGQNFYVYHECPRSVVSRLKCTGEHLQWRIIRDLACRSAFHSRPRTTSASATSSACFSDKTRTGTTHDQAASRTPRARWASLTWRMNPTICPMADSISEMARAIL